LCCVLTRQVSHKRATKPTSTYPEFRLGNLRNSNYENALALELTKRGHRVEQQRSFPVHYNGVLVGELIPDLIVDEKVIADPKVVTAFNDAHHAQMIGYLQITGLKLALLLNFKSAKLDWKRIVL